MKSHLRFAKTVIKHKWFVFLAGRRVGVSLWRLIIHDWSKFTPIEWGPYVRRFGRGAAGAWNKANDPDEFHRAWTHHWHVNAHHWEHWLTMSDGPDRVRPLEMPERFVREMVADWMGAGRAYVGRWEIDEWYASHRDKMILHSNTRLLVESLLNGAKSS